MQYFARDYGDRQADGSYELGTTFLSVSASIIYVGEFVGALAAAPINDKFGRKAVFACASVCIIIGAVIQVCAYGIYGVFYVGRVFVGLGVGQFTATCLMYVSDVAPSAIRGPALMMFQFMQSIAQLVGACVNQGTETIDGQAQYRLPMGLLVILPLTMLILLLFTPESPVWYMAKDRKEDARKSLVKINRSNRDYDVETDFKLIEDQIAIDREMATESSWASLIFDPVERRKLIYACGVMFVQQINGIQFWYTYGVVFAQSIGVGEPFTINTIIYVVQIVTVGLSVIFGNKIKRRTNLLVSTIGMLVSLICVGGLGTTKDSDGNFTRAIGIVIVVFAYVNIVFYNFSIGVSSHRAVLKTSADKSRHSHIQLPLKCQSAATATRSPPVRWGHFSSQCG